MSTTSIEITIKATNADDAQQAEAFISRFINRVADYDSEIQSVTRKPGSAKIVLNRRVEAEKVEDEVEF